MNPLLIVDDDPGNLAVMREILAGEYPLAFASTGTEGLSAARKLIPSLILLDIQMPDMDGYSVCRQLKADPALEHIPVIFVSSLFEAGNEMLGFEAGGVDYISKPVSPPIVHARVRTHLSLVKTSRLEKSYRDAIGMLGAAGEYKDTDTGAHVWRMAAYARTIAAEAGWGRERLDMLELAAPMHDIGKVGIPDFILLKPGKLDASEWETMRTHCRYGYEILSRSDAPAFVLAATVALYHHEKWDGNGYPDGLVGEAIPEPARIVAIADVFDALTMVRPYKEAWPIEKVIRTIKEGSGTHFEPRLVDAFLTQLPRILEIRSEWNAREQP